MTTELPANIIPAQMRAAVEALGLTWDSGIVEVHMTPAEVVVVSEAQINGHNRVDDQQRMCLVRNTIPIAGLPGAVEERDAFAGQTRSLSSLLGDHLLDMGLTREQVWVVSFAGELSRPFPSLAGARDLANQILRGRYGKDARIQWRGITPAGCGKWISSADNVWTHVHILHGPALDDFLDAKESA